MNLNLGRSRKRYKNKQKMDNYCLDLLRGKIEFLLSEYGLGETCKMSTSIIERILNVLRSQGKENAIVEYKIKKSGIEKNYVLLGVNDQIIKIDLKLGVAEISNCTKTISEEEKPTEYIDLEDLSLEENDVYLYTLDDFIYDTNNQIITRKVMPSFRPIIFCEDGFCLSVQASNLSASKPRANNRTDYTHFEVSEVYDEISELEPYRRIINLVGGHSKNVYEYVPKKLVEEILEKHGGIDVEKTLSPSILDEHFNENLGFNHRINYLDGILKRIDRYDELSRLPEEEIEK